MLNPIFLLHPFFCFFDNIIYFSWKSFNLLIEFGVSSSIFLNTTLGYKSRAFDWICIMCTSVKICDSIAWACRVSYCPPSSHSFFLLEILHRIVLGNFLEWVLIRYAIYHLILLYLLRTYRKYGMISKRCSIIRFHLLRNHQAPMSQTLFIFLFCLF